MKKLLSVILAAVIITVLSACGAHSTDGDPGTPDTAVTAANKDTDIYHTLYYKDGTKSGSASATFFNSVSGESETVEMKMIGSDDNSDTYSCEGNTELYNMAYVVCGDKKIKVFDKFAFNKCVSGWYKTENDLLPYTQGAEYSDSGFDEFTLTVDGGEKHIQVWKPDDYDASSDEKYSAVYVLDAQGCLFSGTDIDEINGRLFVNEQVRAMTAATGNKAIVVAIDSGINRDYEYVPEIGDSADEIRYRSINGSELSDEFEGMNGSRFAEFVADTLVPYIRERYNVYTDALHTAVSGYSLGGLESFYIAMEYPEIFGTVGAMSPSFWEYDNSVWNRYLKDKSFGSDSPFIWFYVGGSPDVPYADVSDMCSRLDAAGYPGSLIVMHYDEEGGHESLCWRNVFSEFLTAMIYRRIAPLQ